MMSEFSTGGVIAIIITDIGILIGSAIYIINMLKGCEENERLQRKDSGGNVHRYKTSSVTHESMQGKGHSQNDK